MNVHSHGTPQMWPQSGGNGKTKALGSSVESPRAPDCFDFAGFLRKTDYALLSGLGHGDHLARRGRQEASQ
jgi:hypothetical protein